MEEEGAKGRRRRSRWAFRVGIGLTALTGLVLLAASPPTVSITTPQPLQKITGVYKIQAATIDDSGIQQTTFIIDGQPIQVQFEAIPLKSVRFKKLLMDIPALKTSSLKKGTSLTGYLYNYYAYWYSYRWSDGAHLITASVVDKANYLSQDSLYALSENSTHVDPQISTIVAEQSPLHLVVSGEDFLPGAQVFINRSVAPTTIVQSSSEIVVGGGSALLGLLPIGMPVPIAVVNPDGGGSGRYNFILSSSCPTISLYPGTLPNAVLGFSYDQTVSANGGAGPYTYAITSGDLPAGLSLSSTGQIAGAPFTTGTSSFAITATDMNGCAGTGNYSITVTVPPPTVMLIRKMGSPFRFVVTGTNLQDGIKVYISGTQWMDLAWKSTTKIVIKGGASLKALVPPNTPVTFTFINPDGGTATISNWSW